MSLGLGGIRLQSLLVLEYEVLGREGLGRDDAVLELDRLVVGHVEAYRGVLDCLERLCLLADLRHVAHGLRHVVLEILHGLGLLLVVEFERSVDRYALLPLAGSSLRICVTANVVVDRLAALAHPLLAIGVLPIGVVLTEHGSICRVIRSLVD